eukprot:TRINITY_DN5728_c0_g1_i4.p1 TRINITY_DN5728_c0_g1~~TRINITY_DN5728_c0_g1_i4.p1  ORF type:complete len:132 (-),score=33.21 TRINITY_DN5728_c0_g1_i4:132-527(-)
MCIRDSNKKNETGNTPLHLAARNGSLECIRLLAEAGAVLDKHNDSGDTPLHYAAANGNPEAIKMVLGAHSSMTPLYVDDQNERGETPIHVAVEHNRPSSVKLLCEAAADLEIQNEQGSTCLLYTSPSPRDS